jgi:murein DD-endopeptidase MepM/ murein hydrolase activator NlpD
MRPLLLLVTACAWGETFRVEPLQVPQGGVIRVSGNGVSARLNGREITLFPQSEGAALGLMPIGALHKPGTFVLEVVDAKGAVLHQRNVVVRDARFPRQNIALTPKIAALQPAPGEQEAADAFRTTITPERFWVEPFERPVPGCMGSPYGVARMHNGKLTGNYHGGLDQHGATGQPIRAIAAGTVRLARPFRLLGNAVGVDHGQGVSSIYMHMSKFAVAEGARVQKGDVIGYVGATGRVNGPHLHWSIYVNGVPVNPRPWVQVSSCR